MRIIAGTAKGRRIEAPDTQGTRPATDRVREAVFSMLGDRVVGSRVLDLYAGSGSFGFEALSRGALEATFVESGRRALGALRKNRDLLDLGGEVVARPVRAFLAGAEPGYDIVFIDPPWDLPSGDLGEELAWLEPLIDGDGRVVASRRHSDEVPPKPETWRVATNRRYGDTRILIYETSD